VLSLQPHTTIHSFRCGASLDFGIFLRMKRTIEFQETCQEILLLSSMVKLSLAGQPFHGSCISTTSRLTRLSHIRLPQSSQAPRGGMTGVTGEDERIHLQTLRPSVGPWSEKAEKFRFRSVKHHKAVNTTIQS
jgi:hypothetical protein